MAFTPENCWGGNLEACKAYCARTNMTVERVRGLYALQGACENGHLDIARWLQQTFQLTVLDVRKDGNCALRWTCANGHLEVARWLQQTFQLTVTDARAGGNCALRGACEHGHLEVARWLQQTFQLTAGDAQACDNYALRWACEFGHLEVARWLQQTFQLDPYVVQAACNLQWERTSRDRLEVIRWLQRTWGCPPDLQEFITTKAPANAPWTTYVRNLRTLRWSPRTHADFPLHARRLALLLLLVCQRLVGEPDKPGALPYLPPELWHHLLSYLPAYLPAAPPA